MAILLENVLNLMNYQQSELYNSETPEEHPDYNKWLEKLPSELSKGILVKVVERDDGAVKAVSDEVVDISAKTEKLTITIYTPVNLDSFAFQVGHALSNKFNLKKHLANHPRAKNPLFNEIVADLVKSFITKIGFLGESKAELEQVLGKQAYGSFR